MSTTTKKKFKLRYEEGYDVKDDELYNVWSKLNELKLDGGEKTQDLEPTRKSQQCATADSSQEIREVFKQNLVLPDKVPCKTTQRALQKLPEHLSGNEAIAKMEDQIQQKQIEEEKKKKQKEERELRKLQKQKEKAIKQNQKKGSKKTVAAKTKKFGGTLVVDDEDDICPVGCKDDPTDKWICCDLCDMWYCIKCVNITLEECVQLKDVDWYFSGCVD